MAAGRKTGGRQRGTRNVATPAITAFATALVGRKKYLAQLRRSFDHGTADTKLQILMWHYAHGQPTKHVEVSGSLTLEELVTGHRRED
jgi:hypothetical protein